MYNLDNIDKISRATWAKLIPSWVVLMVYSVIVIIMDSPDDLLGIGAYSFEVLLIVPWGIFGILGFFLIYPDLATSMEP